MGCFLGCFGGAKESKTPRKHRVNRGSPKRQRNRVQKVQQEVGINGGEQSIEEKPKTDLISEFLNKPEEESQGMSPSPGKRVTFSSNVTTYEHVAVHESVDSLPDGTTLDVEQEISKSPSRSHSPSDHSNSSVASSVASYPPNHRYHNARYSDDEAEEYGDSDLDDVDDEDEFDDEDDDDDAFSESLSTESVESKTGDSALQTVDKDVGSKNNPRERSDCISSVFSPVENLSQWRAAKTRGKHELHRQKENVTSNIASEPTSESKPNQTKSSDQEVSVDASLSTWLASPKTTTPSKRSGGGRGSETITSKQEAVSGGWCNNSSSVMSFEDRPILGALTVEELRQISASNSPRKSPSPSPDDVPIIGTVGTYWNHPCSEKKKMVSDSATSYKGIPNTTSKYREDKTVNWHSTPFETRLNRALNQRV